MNSDYDITLHTDETSSPGTARGRFLEALGLEAVPTAEPAETAEEGLSDEMEDDGVVLSSQPDDLELPAAVDDASSHRASSISLGASPERTRTVAISITAKDRQPVETTPAATVATPSLEESLHLECPECHGELVLQRRHIGIEGLCVWCHTPIIAAESARDSVVRVFPVLGRITKPFSSPVPDSAPTAPESPAPVSEALPAPVEEKAAALETPVLVTAPAPVEVPAEIVAPAPVAETAPAENAATAFSPEAFGFGLPPATTAASAPLSPAGLQAKEEVSAFDLEALYDTGGFGNSGPEIAAPVESPIAQEPMTGFGAFLQAGAKEQPAPDTTPAPVSWSTPATDSAPSVEPEASFSAAMPWGPPAKAPTAPAVAANDAAPVPLSSDFAIGFGVPTATPSVEEPTAPSFTTEIWAHAFEDSALPLEKESATPAPAPVDDFASAFGMSGFGSPAGQSELGDFSAPGQSSAAPEAPAKPLNDDFAATFASAGFAIPEAPAPAPVEAPASGSGFAAFVNPDSPAFAAGTQPSPAPVLDGTETPDFTFQSSPASKLLFGGDAMEEKRSFAMPGNSFSTGSSSETDASTFSSFLAPQAGTVTGTAAANSWGISEPLGLSSPDDAPVTLPAGLLSEPSSLANSASPFENSSFPDFSSSPVTEGSQTPISLFQDSAPQAPAVTPPALPAPAPVIRETVYPAAPTPAPAPAFSQATTFSSIANPIEAAAPNVVSEPLGSRPKPKVRKGFIVLMVVIVGFAAGGALASFVLPIDQYVQAARALMEKKFNPSSVVQQMPAMPLQAGDTAEPAANVAP